MEAGSNFSDSSENWIFYTWNETIMYNYVSIRKYVCLSQQKLTALLFILAIYYKVESVLRWDLILQPYPVFFFYFPNYVKWDYCVTSFYEEICMGQQKRTVCIFKIIYIEMNIKLESVR